MHKLIIFGEDWGAHPSSTQHLAKYLQNSHQVTWINSVGMRAPSLKLRDIKRIMHKFKLGLWSFGKGRAKSNSQTFEVINPVVLPWHNNSVVNCINRRQIGKAIEPRQKNEKRTYWLSLPTALSLIDIQPQDTLVYYCGDDFYSLAGVDPKMIEKWEPLLIDRADAIFVASQHLYANMPRAKTHLLEHGVDFALFNTPTKRHSLIPDGTTIGFYGSISEWLDIKLIGKVAKAYPKVNIMLVGAIKTDVSQLKDLQNVHFVNAVEHHQLPQLSQHWQALLMPFKHNKQIEACNPLKLKEYMATGQPIISTRFPAVKCYDNLVHIANSHDDFISLTQQVLTKPSEQVQRLACLQANSVKAFDWSVKAQDVQHILSQFQ